MINSLLRFPPTILIALLVFGFSVSQAAEPEVIYSDDFASVRGYMLTKVNGEKEELGGRPTRDLIIFMPPEIAGGELSMRAWENHIHSGPDGKPGLLYFSYILTPSSIDYSGFIYQGKIESPIKLPFSQGNVNDEHLKRVTISFRYKALNTQTTDPSAKYIFRFETNAKNSFKSRLNFEVLNATGEWKTFEHRLGEGTNRSEFLKEVNASPDHQYKFVWAQKSAINKYDFGDTLLIDDLSITLSE